jgi:hypothetical protein
VWFVRQILKLTRCYPRDFTLITRTAVLAPATLAALQSTRAIPDRDMFCVADPISSIHSERFLCLFAGGHDGERAPGTPKRSTPSTAPLMHHKRLMMDRCPHNFAGAEISCPHERTHHKRLTIQQGLKQRHHMEVADEVVDFHAVSRSAVQHPHLTILAGRGTTSHGA